MRQRQYHIYSGRLPKRALDAMVVHGSGSASDKHFRACNARLALVSMDAASAYQCLIRDAGFLEAEKEYAGKQIMIFKDRKVTVDNITRAVEVTKR